VFFVVILYLYFKYKHKHWLNQPIHNKYDPRLWYRNGVITDVVKFNKYFKPMCYSSNWIQVPTEKKALLKFFLESHYNYYTSLPLSFTIENLNSYLTKHNSKCYVTLQYKDPVKQKKLIGSILSKPIEGRFYNKDLNLYYWDFICINPGVDKKVYFETLYTHYKRHRESNIVKYFLFRSIEKIEIATSLVQYESTLFPIKFFPNKIKSNCKNVSFIMLTSGNYRLFLNMYYKLYEVFDCFLHVNISQLTYLLDQKLLFITLIMLHNKPIACYFFKNTHSLYYKSPVLSLVGSYQANVNDELFLEGFYNSILLVFERIRFKNIMIENLAHNEKILNDVKKFKPLVRQTVYYYFYNFAYRPFKNDQVLFLL